MNTIQESPFSQAVAVAAELRKVSPRHELLRLVKTGNPDTADRLNEERIERFYTGKPEDFEKLSASELDRITFTALADAMHEAMKKEGHAPMKIAIKGIRLHIDPAVTLYNVELESTFPEGIYAHTAPSKEHLDAFFDGVRAATGVLGLYVTIPDLPSDWYLQDAYVKEPESEPELAREEEDIPL